MTKAAQFQLLREFVSQADRSFRYLQGKPKSINQTFIQLRVCFYVLQLCHPFTSSKIKHTLDIQLSAAVKTGRLQRPTAAARR
jgi:hypothetical protein